VALVPRIKRKIKKFFKNKWFKVVLLSIGVFAVFTLIAFFIPSLLVAVSGGSLSTGLLLKASLLINAIIYPLWFKECLRVVERYEAKRKTNKRKHKKTSKKSDL